VSWLAWIAGLGPVAGVAFGIALGWGWANARSAKLMGALEAREKHSAETIDHQRETIAILSQPGLSDSDFRDLLREESTG